MAIAAPIRITASAPRIGREKLESAQNTPTPPRAVDTAHKPERSSNIASTGGFLAPADANIVTIGDGPPRFIKFRMNARRRRYNRATVAAPWSPMHETPRPNATKPRFLAVLSHELRAPLDAILGFAGLFESGRLTEAQRRDYVRLIREAGEHLLRVVDRLRELAGVEAGKIEIEMEAGIDPRRLCEVCIGLVAQQAKGAGLRLALDIADHAPPLFADRTRLVEILLNLLSNAIKFTAPGGEVVLAVRAAGDGGAAFEIRDTGVGMTADEIDLALRPFASNGLGLPLARRFVELHGGSLEIASAKGSGTTVTVVLPAGEAAAAGAHAAAIGDHDIG
jgi:signal transduction histidine kinase